MLQINQVKLLPNYVEADIRNKIIDELCLKRIFKYMPAFSYKIIRRSIDARKKPDVYYTFTFAVDFKNEKTEEIVIKKCKNKNLSKYNPAIYNPKTNIKNNCKRRPVVVGEGPCGLFAGYILAKAGLMPIIIERGDKVDKRVEKVDEFWSTGSVDENTNVQFGEGGAGTFSDGKLNTLVKDKTGKNQFVLNTFVKYGANEEIAYDAKPHVGTDVLRDVVVNLRDEIISLGGDVINLCRLTDIVADNKKIKAISVDNYSGEDIEIKLDLLSDKTITLSSGINMIDVDDVILAIGHSSRDTFNKLYSMGIHIEQKNFALGIRIQHPQCMIDNSQYGVNHSEKLPKAVYKVTNHTSNNRDVFSFCMCPGGYVVNASSVPGHTCVNGMSYSGRDSINANSALIVAVDRKDFGSDNPLAGMHLQEKLEKRAFEIGNGHIPVQLFSDFCNNEISTDFGEVKPAFKGKTCFANLREIFPEEVSEALIESINKFGYTIEGFDSKDAILAAIESRTSSPIRITRDDTMQSNIIGLYPAGEGAGYAGGIMSAAMDGIRVAEAIIQKYDNE